MLTLGALDLYGRSDPDNNEGHPEDRCTVCEWPVVDHLPTYSSARIPARWPHRRAAVLALSGERWDRLVARLVRFAHRA